MTWLLRSIALFPLLAFAQEERPARALPPTEMLDRHISTDWKKNGVTAARAADDAEFLRRTHLDILGSIPPMELVLRFLADKAAHKRSKLIDELLESDRYPENWAEIWEAMLIGYDYGVKNDSGDSLMSWLRDEVFGKNLRYDEMFRQIITANGTNKSDGRTVFFWRLARGGGQAPDVTTRVSRIFLGTQIQCAQCHDHPFDKWTQDDFYGVTAFFARLRQKKVRPEDQRDQEFEVYEATRGETEYGDGKARKRVPPKFLDGLAPEAAESRRGAFARIVSRPENTLFAKALVNRYWGHFFGRGLVHPIEEFNDRNRASHPQLLDDLAAEFVDHKYDLKWLIRTICNSKTYQLSSRRSGKETAPARSFSYSLTRSMTPEEMLNSLIEATGTEEKLRAQARRAGGNLNVDNFKREMQRQFRFTFGDDENVDLVEFDGTIPQALMMMNSELTNRGIVETDGRLDLILRTRSDPSDRVAMIFLSTLGRHPNPRELARYGAHLASLKSDKKAYEDIFWALINSSEFIFSH